MDEEEDHREIDRKDRHFEVHKDRRKETEEEVEEHIRDNTQPVGIFGYRFFSSQDDFFQNMVEYVVDSLIFIVPPLRNSTSPKNSTSIVSFICPLLMNSLRHSLLLRSHYLHDCTSGSPSL